MDRFDGLTDFLAVAEAASFTKAAQNLERSKAAVSESIARLEKRLGVRLFERTTRQVRLTEAGAAYHEAVAALPGLMENAELATLELHRRPRGTLRVTVPHSLAWTRLAPLMPEFLERFPDLSIEMDASNTVRDLVKDGFDLSIRASIGSDPNRVVRRLWKHRALLVASPAWVEKHGAPKTPRELAQRDCALFEDLPGGRRSVTLKRGREELRIPLRGNLSSNSLELLHSAVLGGYGFGLLPDYLVASDLEAGRLKQLLPEWRYPDIEVQAVYPHNRHISAKVRTFVDFLARRL